MIDEKLEWSKAEPASTQDMEKLKKALDFNFPEKYLDFLKYSNGGEGDLFVQPFYIVFDDVDFVIERNLDESKREFFPGYVFFATNGAGELFGFVEKTGEIVSIDSTNIDLTESVLPVAENFETLIGYIGKESPDA